MSGIGSIYTVNPYTLLDLMGRITLSGCARNDRITRDEVEFDPVAPGAATHSDRSIRSSFSK